MSRSFKKNPASTSSGSGFRKFSKRWANKAVRHSDKVSNGKGYKKLFCSYDIGDWKNIYHSPRDFSRCYREINEKVKGVWINRQPTKKEIERKFYKTMNK